MVYGELIGVAFFEFLTVGVVVLGFLGLFLVVFKNRSSQNYRKLITDMYVASKTRFLAKEDGLDLEKEEDDFKIWLKKDKIRTSKYDLDDTIEEELKERISEPKKKDKK